MTPTYKSNKFKIYYLYFAFFAAMVLPFVLLFIYNQPTSEDFFYSEVVKKVGFINAQRHFHKFWGGRFIYYILISTNPLIFNSVTGYKILTFVAALFSFGIFYLFVSKITYKSLPFANKLLFVICFTFLYLYSMPSTGQGFYWLGSALNYHLPVTFSLLFYIFIMKINDAETVFQKIHYSFVCLISTIIATGSNEFSAIVFVMSIIFLYLKIFFVDKKRNQWLLMFLFVSLIICYFSFSAPSNIKKSLDYPNSQDILYSLTNSLVFTVKELASYIFFSPVTVITILLIPVFLKLVNSGKISSIFNVNPVYSFLTLIIFFFSGSFIMLWSSGILPYDRILNIMYFVFLLGWFYNTIVLINYINRKYKIANIKYPKSVYAVIYLALAFLIINENNIVSAYNDLLSGKAEKFNQALTNRYSELKEIDCVNCEIDSIKTVPKSFFFLDINRDTASVYNRGYAMYFNKKSIVIK